MKNFLFGLTILGFTTLCYSQIEDKRHPLYMMSTVDDFLKDTPEITERDARTPYILRERDPNFATSRTTASFEDNLLAVLDDTFMINDNYIFESLKEKSPESKTTKIHVNDEYYDAVAISVDCERINTLETLVANFDITQQAFYNASTNTYQIGFKEGHKNGQITAVFNSDGNLVESLERFKDIRLPRNILDAINNEYPGAIIKTNTYIVKYDEQSGTNKLYKVKIDVDGNKKSLKLNSNGQFI